MLSGNPDAVPSKAGADKKMNSSLHGKSWIPGQVRNVNFYSYLRDLRMIERVPPIFFLSISIIVLLTLGAAGPAHARNEATVYFFWGEGCPSCKHEKPFLAQLERKYPELKIKSYEVWHSRENAELFSRMARAYGTKVEVVPTTFIGDFEPLVGYFDDEVTGKSIETAIRHCIEYGCTDPIEKLGEFSSPAKKGILLEERKVIRLPLFGEIDTSKISLPVLTIVIAGLDGFNPCAFFVLLLLLSILVYAHSRKIMLLIGGTFVFFSGFVYFLFMAAWLNLFLLFGQLREITVFAGAIAVIIAAINIKDFFFFKRGISLGIPEEAKSKLFGLARNLLKTTSRPSMIVGTIVLALAANTYELLCTAGFPMVYARALTLRNLPVFQYYLYLVFYNVIYVIPLMVIVLVFSATLGTRKLSERQGRVLKLISGTMMLYLGFVLLLKPDLLNNIFVSAGLLALSLATTGIMILITRTNRSKPDS